MFEETEHFDEMSKGYSSSIYFQSSPSFNTPSAWQYPFDQFDQLEIAYSDSDSEIDSDDSSKYLNKLYVDDYYGQQLNDPISSTWSGQHNDSIFSMSSGESDTERFIVTLSTPSKRFFETSDPMH